MVKLFLAVIFAVSIAMVVHGSIQVKTKSYRIREKQREREQKFIEKF